MMTEEQQKLVESNINLVYAYVHKYGLVFGHDFDDSVQIASVGLCKAAMRYDANKGIAFSTYAYACMENEFKMIARHKQVSTVSIEDIMYSDSSKDDDIQLSDMLADPINNVEDYVICKDQIRYVLNKLNESDRKIIEYMLRDPSLRQIEIAELVGCSQPSISRAIKRFKQLYHSS